MALCAWLEFQPLHALASLLPAAQIAIAAVLVAFVVILMQIAQSSRRFSDTESPDARRDRDDCWKMGVFYVNPDDPALFTPKRFGIGYTLNFANPWSWVVLALTLLPAVVLALWLPLHVIHRVPAGLRSR